MKTFSFILMSALLLSFCLERFCLLFKIVDDALTDVGSLGQLFLNLLILCVKNLKLLQYVHRLCIF